MKVILWAILIIALSFESMGQSDVTNVPKREGNVEHVYGDLNISLSANQVSQSKPYESLTAGGLKVKMFVGKRFSFNTDLVFGKDYSHFGPGVIGLPLWLLLGENFRNDEDVALPIEDFLAYVAIIILSMEHFSYHIPVNNSIEISPYISLLRLKQMSNVEHSENIDKYESWTSFAVGVEINKYMKRFVLSPFVECNTAYKEGPNGVNVGINIGYYFPRK